MPENRGDVTELLDQLRLGRTEFERDPGAFKPSANPAAYAALPHGTGINTYVRVKLNGVWTDQDLGATVRDAFEKSALDPHSSLAKLSVRKLHDGKLYRVEWDRSTDQILDLPLEGGEEFALVNHGKESRWTVKRKLQVR